MTGLWINVATGFGAAFLLFGGLLGLVFWLYRLAFGHAMRLPMAGFSNAENTGTTLFFGLMLAGGLVWSYQQLSQDYFYWNTYTLPKFQPIDYVITSLVLMPPLFWFAGSLVAAARPKRIPAGAEASAEKPTVTS